MSAVGSSASAAASFSSRLAADRSVFPHQYNCVQDQVLLVGLAPAAQAQASFLDERALAPGTQGAWFAFDAVAKAAQALGGAPQGYIFHVGHCGSTLLSRLVAEATHSAALREPLPLRTLAMDKAEGPGGLLGLDGFARRLSLFERLWARGEKPVVVKATSICTDLADVVDRNAERVFAYQPPDVHLAVVLAGANALMDLRGFAQLRYRRLAGLFDFGVLSGFSAGMLAALTWLAETSAAARSGGKLSLFNFEAFLKDPAPALDAVCRALGFQPSPDDVARAVAGPIMTSYSKATEHAYDAALREQVIAQSRRENAAEIKAGMVWLEGLARENAPLADLLNRFS